MLRGENSNTLTLQRSVKLVGARLTHATLTGLSNEVHFLIAPPVSVESSAMTTFVRDVECYHNLTHPCLLNCHGFAVCKDDQRFINHEATSSHRESHEDFSCFSGREIANYVTLWEDCGALQDARSYVSGNQQRSVSIMYDIAKAVQYLHTHGITHGSLRLNNILVCNGHAKLDNFHLGHMCHKFKCRSRQLVQNDRFTAPEFFAGFGGDVPCVSFAADVFHLSLCALKLLTWEPPYGMLPDEDVVSILSGQRSYPCPDGVDLHIWSELSKLIAHDPADRPTIDEVVDRFADMTTGTVG